MKALSASLDRVTGVRIEVGLTLNDVAFVDAEVKVKEV